MYTEGIRINTTIMALADACTPRKPWEKPKPTCDVQSLNATWGRLFRRIEAPSNVQWDAWALEYGVETVRYAIRKADMHRKKNGKMSQPAIVAFMDAALKHIGEKRVKRKERIASQLACATSPETGTAETAEAT